MPNKKQKNQKLTESLQDTTFAKKKKTSKSSVASDKINSPHDVYFKKNWSNPDFVRSFLNTYLPPEICTKIKMDTLEICKDSFVTKDMKEVHSDMLYKIQLEEKEMFLYILFEHKSYPDRMIFIQLCRYILSIFEMYLQENKSVEDAKNLPLVLPLVLYHGKEKWNMPVEFSRCFRSVSKEMQNFVPNFCYTLFDLSTFSDEEIKGSIENQIALLILKHIFRSDLLAILPKVSALLRDLDEQETGLQALETLFRYLTNTEQLSSVGFEKIQAALETNLSEDKKGAIMTIADQLRQEGAAAANPEIFNMGMQKGWQGGRFEGVRQTAFQFKMIGTPIEIIERATGLSREEIEGLDGSVDN